MDVEDAVQELIQKHKFKPGEKYTLERIKEIDGKNGGTLEIKEKVHTRTFQLERDPDFGTGLYDLKDEDDFKRFFEENYGNLDNGKYLVRKKLGNDGWSYFLKLRLENGKVVNWWKKSKATNPRQNSSTYYAFPEYFNLREDLGV